MAGVNTASDSNPVLDAAVNAANRAASRSEEARVQQVNLEASRGASETNIQEGIINIASDTGLISLVEGVAELKAQNTRIGALDAAGGREFLTELMAELKESSADLLEAQEGVTDITSETPSGLLSYIGQQLQLLGPESRLEAAEGRVDNVSDIITTITGAQESVSRAVATTKRKVNVATIDAGQRIIAERAVIDSANARLASISDRAAGLRSSMAADAATVAAKIEILKLRNSEKSRKQRAAEHKLQVQTLEVGAESRNVALATAKENLDDIRDPKRRALVAAKRDEGLRRLEDGRLAEELFTSNVRLGQSVLGLSVEEGAAVVKRGMPGGSGTAADRLKYTKLRDVGLREGNAYGFSPGEALETITITGVDPELPPAKLLIALNREFQESFAGGMSKLPTKTAAYMQAFDTYATPRVASWRAEIKAGDSSNPFQAPPMAVLVDRAAVKDSALFKNVLAAADMKEFDAKRLYNLAVSGVASKSITMEEAALGLEAIFDAAVDHNNETNMYDRIGLAEQTSYRTEIAPQAFFSTGLGGTADVVAASLGLAGTAVSKAMLDISANRVIDNTDRSQIMHALNRLVAKEAAVAGGIFK